MAVDSGDWLSRAIIYSVFVRNHGNIGGFDEVTRDLQRIRELGTDIVWLMPIHPLGKIGRKGTLGSPYAISDYRAINPEFGDASALSRLINRCHELGMKIIIDVVYNHTSPDSLLAKQHPDWFLLDESGKPMPKFPEWSDIVDLRYYDETGNKRQELWDYQIESLRQWIVAGVDGFRCDVASLVPVDFWLEARQKLGNGKEVIWLAETVHLQFNKFMRERGYAAWSDSEILGAFDLSYDYDGGEQLDHYFAGTGRLKDYLRQLEIQATMNPQRGWKLRFNENHDQPRVAAKIHGVERLRCWTVFQALLPGAYLVFAGQELNAPHMPSLFDADQISLPIGKHGADISSPELANAGFTHHQASFYPWFQKLLHLSKQIKAECPHYQISEIAEGIILIRWSSHNDYTNPNPTISQYAAVLNLEDRFGKFGLIPSLKGLDLLSNQAVLIEAGSPIPKDALILKLS